MLIKYATNAKYKDKQNTPKFLNSLTHLSLDNKNITKIENLDQCTNIGVLYLFENRIQIIEGLTNLTKIVQLSLYNNNISKMEGLDTLVSLRKLYLERNSIERLEGLQHTPMLEELYLSKQNLARSQEFTFCDYSLATISVRKSYNIIYYYHFKFNLLLFLVLSENS